MDIAVVIASRNRPHYLAQCLESVMRQDLQPSTVVVVDDGSELDLSDVQRLYSDRLPLKWLQQSRKGVCAARNLAARVTSEPLTCILDDDDVMVPGRLRSHVEHFERESVDVSYGGWINYEEGAMATFFPGKPFSETAFFLEGGLFVHGGCAVRTDLLRTHPYTEHLVAGGDFDMFSRLVLDGARFGHCGSYVLFRRLHSERLGAIAETREVQRNTRRAVVERIEAEWRARNDVRERPRTANFSGLRLDLAALTKAARLPTKMYTVFHMGRKLEDIFTLRFVLERWPVEGIVRSDRPSSAMVEVVLDTRALAVDELTALIEFVAGISVRSRLQTNSGGSWIEKLKISAAGGSTSHTFRTLSDLVRLHDENVDATQFRLIGGELSPELGSPSVTGF